MLGQVSLPMLAPLLLGTGMMCRSIKANASIIFPRIGLLVVLLWVLWFANSVVQNTVMYLRRQGAIDHRCVRVAFCSPCVCLFLVCLAFPSCIPQSSMVTLRRQGMLAGSAHFWTHRAHTPCQHAAFQSCRCPKLRDAHFKM